MSKVLHGGSFSLASNRRIVSGAKGWVAAEGVRLFGNREKGGFFCEKFLPVRIDDLALAAWTENT